MLPSLSDILPEPQPKPRLDWTKIDDRAGSTGLYRAIDREAGIVVWRYRSSDKGGLAALPIAQTDLDPVADDG